jgi:hypothetical protein
VSNVGVSAAEIDVPMTVALPVNPPNEVVTVTVADSPGVKLVTVSGSVEPLAVPADTDPAEVAGVKV